jgi:hypothetical protein
MAEPEPMGYPAKIYPIGTYMFSQTGTSNRAGGIGLSGLYVPSHYM